MGEITHSYGSPAFKLRGAENCRALRRTAGSFAVRENSGLEPSLCVRPSHELGKTKRLHGFRRLWTVRSAPHSLNNLAPIGTLMSGLSLASNVGLLPRVERYVPFSLLQGRFVRAGRMTTSLNY